MGRLILVCGANGSGKSAYAEQLAADIGGELYYIATMIPKTPENAARIEAHISRREGLHFTTVELAYRVGDAPVPRNAIVLLEDVANLMANALFDRGESAAQVFADIAALLTRCGTLIAITIAGLHSGAYDGATAAYIDSLNDLNRALLSRADAAVEMKNRIPRIQKGEIGHAL